MANIVQILTDYSPAQKSAPDKLDLDNFDIDHIHESFVISRNAYGKVLSIYKDSIWDFCAYVSDPSQQPLLNFEKNIQKRHIPEVKKAMLLLMIYGNGKGGSQYSVGTLRHYYTNLFVPISKAAIKLDLGFTESLESKKFLMHYIDKECINRQRVSLLLSFLSMLHYTKNYQTKINYEYHKDLIDKLQRLRNIYNKGVKQTEIIPIRILSESLSQRWRQIEEVEPFLQDIKRFLEEFLTSQYFASSMSKKKECPTLNDAKKKYKLEKLFEKYCINNRRDFLSFITQIQGTCMHLIHAYTGMRRGEVLNLKSGCIQKVSNINEICYLVSTTSKLTGRRETAKWVTSKEIERVVSLLGKLNEVVAKHTKEKLSELPLFISFTALLGETPSKKAVAKRRFAQQEQLLLNQEKLIVTQNDKEQVRQMHYMDNFENIVVGKPWIFKTHQYRRSLAVYSIQSGVVSLGTLQKQFKHLFKEMTLYYTNGASFAKKLFDFPKDHIANDINKLKPKVTALMYIRDVLFSEEKLYGTHGKLIQKNKNGHDIDFNILYLQNRDKTIRQFKNGEIAYKETALGGCTAIEHCDSSLTRSFTACFECDSGILKKSKINNVIEQQENFLTYLDNSSVEYRTELEELETLIQMRDKLIKD